MEALVRHLSSVVGGEPYLAESGWVWYVVATQSRAYAHCLSHTGDRVSGEKRVT